MNLAQKVLELLETLLEGWKRPAKKVYKIMAWKTHDQSS